LLLLLLKNAMQDATEVGLVDVKPSATDKRKMKDSSAMALDLLVVTNCTPTKI